MTDEEFYYLVPRYSKVKIIETQEVFLVIGFVYIDDDEPGYCILLENNKYYSPEFLELAGVYQPISLSKKELINSILVKEKHIQKRAYGLLKDICKENEGEVKIYSTYDIYITCNISKSLVCPESIYIKKNELYTCGNVHDFSGSRFEKDIKINEDAAVLLLDMLVRLLRLK